MQEFNYSKTIHFVYLHWLGHKTRNLITFDTGMIQLEKDLRIFYTSVNTSNMECNFNTIDSYNHKSPCIVQ